ncbi:MAG: alkaline phosphatase family protein [Bacteroidales bacterium]|nr:alkaline phosphatase family protein [Bacteroidales bacterium]MBN2820965.1 alkaline phosphatase family protein [Bacteroidales bacterium]
MKIQRQKIQHTLFAIVLFILFSPEISGQESRPSDHVILISIDGLHPEFYLDEKLPAPNLQEMRNDGCYALGVRGIFPSVTYPSHATIITGALPNIHGIYYNSPFDTAGQSDLWYWYTNMIKTPTLWHATRKAGLTSASFIWPVSVDGPIDYNIPEIWDPAIGFNSVEPMRAKETPKGLMAEMEKAVLGQLNEKTFNGDYLNREDRTGEMAAYVLEKYKPNFMTVHLIATDHFQHLEGREGPMVRKSLAAADRAVGKIIEAAQRAKILDRTTIIVVGDHGFVNIQAALCPNIWLVEEGLLEDSKDRGNWKAAFHTSGASAFLHLKDKNDSVSLDKVKQKIESLSPEYRKLFRVVDRSELDAIGADPNALLALAPIPGVSMSANTSGQIVKAAYGGTHGFFPDFKEIETGFVAWGAGIASGVEIQHMGLEDIAPVVSYLLNLDFKAQNGILYPGIKSKSFQK